MDILETQSTNASTERDVVIIIKPEQDKVQDLINNPIEIVTAVEESKFGKLNVKDIKTNKRKGVLVAYVKGATTAIVEELVQVQNLGRWKVHCYVPNKDKFKLGVISPISTSSDIQKIKLILMKSHKIHAIERLNKRVNNEWVPSTSLKITFEARNLPEDVVIGHSLYKVRPYISQPLQCFRCQRLGHAAERCNARIICMVCGGDHVKEVCSAQKEQCANCKGNHKANSKLCEIIKRAYAAEESPKVSRVPGSALSTGYTGLYNSS